MSRCDFCGWDNPDALEYCEKCGNHFSYDVFISYSRMDYVDGSGIVLPHNMLSTIKDSFKNNGISYWFDEDGIYSGDEFASVITRAIRTSKVFLFVSSANSNQSKWTSNEISTALEFGKPIIPFRLDKSPYNDSIMMKIISFDYIECKDDEKAINKLLRAVKHHLPIIDKPQWRNLKVPEGAKGTIVLFDVDGEWEKHVFTPDRDYTNKKNILTTKDQTPNVDSAEKVELDISPMNSTHSKWRIRWAAILSFVVFLLYWLFTYFIR